MKIETERTYIRQFTLDDAEAVLALNGNKSVTRYTGDAGAITNVNEARQVIKEVWLREYSLYGYGRWAVVDKSKDKVIGFCGLKYLPDVGMPDIGYRFLPEYWGQGLASETAIACVSYCQEQLGIESYFGDVMKDNLASIKVLKKLGLKFTGLVQERGFTFMRFKQSSPTLLNTSQFYK